MKKLTFEEVKTRIKKEFSLHWNCIPWIVAGVIILCSPKVTKLEYFATWAVLIGFLWQRPVK